MRALTVNVLRSTRIRQASVGANVGQYLIGSTLSRVVTNFRNCTCATHEIPLRSRCFREDVGQGEGEGD